MSSTNGYLLQHDEADRWLWTRAQAAIPELAEVARSGESQHPGAGSLLRDLFVSLYKGNPVLLDPQTPYQRKRHQLLTRVLETHEFRRLRLRTRLRDYEAALAAMDLFQSLLKEWPEEDPSAGSPTPEAHSDLEARLRATLRQAIAAVGEAGDLVSAWSVAPGDETTTSLTYVVALARRVRESQTLQEIARLAGRMKRLALQKHAVSVRHGADELVAIERGRDLARVLPAELVSLRHPVLRTDFWRRYSEGQLLQYRLSGREPQGRGPVIACLDSSGSMKGPREVWAKAVALGLLTVAARERRDFAVVHFGSASEVRTFCFPRGQASPTQIVEALGFAFHGGTDFEAPLRRSCELLEASPFTKADVVFVTDGICRVSEGFLSEFLVTKARKALRVFSVLVDVETSSRGLEVLESFSNEVYRITNLAYDQAVLDGVFGRD